MRGEREVASGRQLGRGVSAENRCHAAHAARGQPRTAPGRTIRATSTHAHAAGQRSSRRRLSTGKSVGPHPGTPTRAAARTPRRPAEPAPEPGHHRHTSATAGSVPDRGRPHIVSTSSERRVNGGRSVVWGIDARLRNRAGLLIFMASTNEGGLAIWCSPSGGSLRVGGGFVACCRPIR